MRNPRDFGKPLAIGAPAPVREIPFRPSRMIHFLDFSNEKMVAKVADIAPTVDILLGNLEDAVPVDRKVAARDGLVGVGKETDLGETQLWTRVNSLESPWVLDDLTILVDGDRPQARRDHGPQGRGPLGHPLRRPAARAARGQGRPRPADPRPRDPRDGPGRRQPRGDRDRQPPHAGDELRSGRPGGVAADEDHPRRRRPPRLPGDQRPRPRAPRRASPDRPAGPLALLDRPHGRRLHLRRDPPVLRPLRRHPRRRGLRDPVPGRVPARLRRRLVAAPGPDRDRQEGVQPRRRRGAVRQEGAGGDPGRPRRPHDRRQDAGRRHLEAVQGDGHARRDARPQGP